MLTTADIRNKFIAFFKKKNHAIIPSSSLVPNNDPSLLFTNAGMVQFKTIFQGKEKPPVDTATTVQKCVRAGGKHNDLENVGRTARHHTFFEMLGNFSFGAYFKKDAIRYAFEFITEELKLEKERLYITVFLDDDEAFNLWHKECGIPVERIFRLGEKDNFWSMGDTGPCGPCSEIFVDQGESLRCGDTCGIGSCDCDRFLEIWNLVFMQFDQHNDGTRTPLPKPSIDTGSGLERLTAVCQGVYSNYDTDIFKALIEYIASLTQGKYAYKQQSEEIDTAMRVIADHSRAIAFMIADGILPSNEGRGYVLRRIIRRAYRFGRDLELNEEFLYKVVLYVTTLMGEQYKELLHDTTFMQQIVQKEEITFNKTLDKGLILLEELFEETRQQNSTRISGHNAFILHDTYGFPIDIVNDIAEKRGFTVVLSEFEQCIEEQKNRARKAWKGGDTTVLQNIFAYTVDIERTHFVGYEKLHAEAVVQQIYSANGILVDVLQEGEYGYCVLTQSPFYATAGGQESDIGAIVSDTAIVECIGAELSPSGAIIHSIAVVSGIFRKNSVAEARVTPEHRHAIAKNHTATHLAFATLRSLVSPSIRQAGSLVCADKLRFDYTAMQPLSQEQIIAIERNVTMLIQQAIPAHTVEMEYQKALDSGAVSLAGEIYDDTVRVIAFGDYSKELCCGTHVANTGEIGAFVILSDSGVATGIRRIEAITGLHALAYIQEQRNTIATIANQLKCPQTTLLKQIEILIDERKSLQKQIESLSSQLAVHTAYTIKEHTIDLNGYSVLMHSLSDTHPNGLKAIIDILRPSFNNGLILLASTTKDQVHLTIYTGKEFMSHYTAKAILERIAPIIDAKGGGKPDLVQAGGKHPERIQEVFETIKKLL